MIQKDSLIKNFLEMNLDVYETLDDIADENSIQLKNFEDLCRFIKKHNIDTVFYYYFFVNEECLQIGEETFSELKIDKEDIDILQEQFDEYNKSISNLNFNKPYALSIYFLYQNRIFYFNDDDYWFLKEGFGNPIDAALSIIEENLQLLKNEKNIIKTKNEEKRNKLYEQILNDKEFHKCTNQLLRRDYANKIFSNNDELTSLFLPHDKNYHFSILSFIENIWHEYKENKR